MSEKIKRQVKRFYSWKAILVFAVIIAVAGAGALMAGWVDDNGTNSNQIIYTDPTTGYVTIGTNDSPSCLVIRNGLCVLRDDLGVDRGVILTTSMSKDQGLITTPNTTTGLAFRLGADSAGEVMRFTTSKYVGIGTTTPSTRLHVNGTITATNYACSSDARYKKNINPYNNALEKVLGLKGVTYLWNTEKFKEQNFGKEKQIGFLAQDVEKIIPEVVSTDSKGYKSMSYDKLTVVLVEAIKELKAKNDAKLSALEKENSELKQRIASLEKMSDRIAKLERAAMKNNSLMVSMK